MKTNNQLTGMGYETPDICEAYYYGGVICTSVSGGLLDDVTVEEYGEI